MSVLNLKHSREPTSGFVGVVLRSDNRIWTKQHLLYGPGHPEARPGQPVRLPDRSERRHGESGRHLPCPPGSAVCPGKHQFCIV
jgi:hypothetical protein